MSSLARVLRRFSQPFVLNSEEAKILIAIDEKYANLVKVGDIFKFKLDATNEKKRLKSL